MDKVFGNHPFDYEILDFKNEKIGIFHNVSKIWGERLFHEIQNEKKVKWNKIIKEYINEENEKSFIRFDGKIIQENIKFIALKLSFDLLPSRRIFEKEMGYSETGSYQLKFLKILPSENIYYYDKDLAFIEEEYFCIYYFNDGYEGGQIFFPEINYIFYPKKNDLIILPKDYLTYIVSPITGGMQYTLISGIKINE